MTIIPAVLSVITLGAAGSYGYNRYRKMKRELPDNREVRPEDKLATPQSRPKNDPVQQSSATHGTPARQS